MKGLMGGFYRISEWIMRFSAINLLWVVCSIPIFFLLLTSFTVQEVDQVFAPLSLMAVLAPFTLFPATAAMFAVARKWIMGEEDVPLFKTYFRSYKENYKQSMLGGLFFILMIVLLVVNYRFYASQDNSFQVLSIFFLVFFVVLAGVITNFFSIMVHLHMKFFQIVKNAFLITVGRPLTLILMLVTNGFIVFISFRFTFLIPFFMGSLIAYMSFFHFHRMFNKIQDKQQELMEKESEVKRDETASSNEEEPPKTSG